MAEVRVEGGKGHQRHGWVLKSLVRHQGRPKGTSTGGGDPPRDGNALSERESWPSLRSKKGLLKVVVWKLAEVRVEGGKGHQRHGWVLESLVRHQGRPKGTSTGGGDPPRDGNALSEREPNPNSYYYKVF